MKTIEWEACDCGLGIIDPHGGRCDACDYPDSPAADYSCFIAKIERTIDNFIKVKKVINEDV